MFKSHWSKQVKQLNPDSRNSTPLLDGQSGKATEVHVERMGRITVLIFADTPYRRQNDLGSQLLVGLTLGIRVVPYQGLSKKFILFAGRKIRHLMIPFTNLFTALT